MTESIYNARLSERFRIADRLDEMAGEYEAAARRMESATMAEAAHMTAQAFRDAAEEFRRQE